VIFPGLEYLGADVGLMFLSNCIFAVTVMAFFAGAGFCGGPRD
jgi:hypothetical protein